MAARSRLSIGARQLYARIHQEQYVCPSCALQQRARLPLSTACRASTRQSHYHIQRSKPAPSTPLRRTRLPVNHDSPSYRARYTQLASSTAINAPTHVPERYKNLVEKLAKLQEEAAGYIDLARLQLALTSLGKENTTTRVAFLTVDEDGAQAARELARVLLSDPLSLEQPWESELLSSQPDESVLLRFGEPGDLAGSGSLLHSIIVPSKFLSDSRVEILIAPLQTRTQSDSDAPQAVEDALLVPVLPIPAAGGRFAFVRSPVHKAIVVAKGISGAINLGALRIPTKAGRTSIVIDTPLSSNFDLASGTTAVDLSVISKALVDFRLDDTKGGQYGKAWSESSIGSVADQLSASSKESPASGLEYAAMFLDSVQFALERDERGLLTQQRASADTGIVRHEIQDVISQWSAQAHRDLRDNLAVAFESRAWRRTAWWRLFWRIDDVSYSTHDILVRCWLNEAEQTLAYLSGRIRQAGLASDIELKETAFLPAVDKSPVEPTVTASSDARSSTLDLAQLPSMLARVQEQTGKDPLFDPPWPQTIALARQGMLSDEVPSMHRKAQGLLLSTVTTIGGTAALGGWLWVASAGLALYESGAIAALGLVWSLRRLQRLWGRERTAFAQTVHENGRTVLAELESNLRRLVRDAKTADMYEQDLDRVARARVAIEESRRALEDATQAVHR